MNARCWLANVVRGGRIAFEGLVHALVGAILLRLRGPDALVLDAEPQPPDVELGEAVDARGGEGDPLSVRMARGKPWSRKRRSKTGRTPWPLVESRPWHASR